MTNYPPATPDPQDAQGYGAQASTPQYSDPSQSGYAQSGYGQSTYGATGYAGAGYQPKPKSDSKTLGLWAMILGISSIIIPLGLNGLAGVGLGIAGLIKENSKGMSITGIVTGGVGALIWAPVFWTIVIPLIIFAAAYNSGY